MCLYVCVCVYVCVCACVSLHVCVCVTGLVAELFHADLPKDKAIRCGNWDLRPLPPAMVRYAALDAYAGLICHVLLTELPTRYTVGRRASAPVHGLRH